MSTATAIDRFFATVDESLVAYGALLHDRGVPAAALDDELALKPGITGNATRLAAVRYGHTMQTIAAAAGEKAIETDGLTEDALGIEPNQEISFAETAARIYSVGDALRELATGQAISLLGERDDQVGADYRFGQELFLIGEDREDVERGLITGADGYEAVQDPDPGVAAYRREVILLGFMTARRGLEARAALAGHAGAPFELVDVLREIRTATAANDEVR